MTRWVDRKGQTWDVLLTYGALDRIKADTGVDLARAMEDRDLLGRLLFEGFGRKMAEVLWVLCEDQAAAMKIEPEAWADLFDGATIERATTALLEAVADFFPRSRIGKAIRENLPKMLADMDADVLKRLKLSNRGGSSGPAANSPDAAA